MRYLPYFVAAAIVLGCAGRNPAPGPLPPFVRDAEVIELTSPGREWDRFVARVDSRILECENALRMNAESTDASVQEELEVLRAERDDAAAGLTRVFQHMQPGDALYYYETRWQIGYIIVREDGSWTRRPIIAFD